MNRIAIPMPGVREQREPRLRRPEFNGERAVEVYFTILTVVILGMIVGIGAYAVLSSSPHGKSTSLPSRRDRIYP